MPATESGEKGFLVFRDRRGRLFPFSLERGSGRETAASPPSSRALQQLPHGRSLVRWARDRALLPPRLPLPGARPAGGPARSRGSAGRHWGGRLPRQDAHPGPRG